MNENVKQMCICDLGYDKGVLKKTIENNVFTIYGNITKNNYIILRYHGALIDNVSYENYLDNLYITYFFDNDSKSKETICLAKCNKCVGENYCALIYLGEHDKINFNFSLKDTLENIVTYNDNNMIFELNIKSDPLTDIMNKYEKEEASNLPIAPKDSEIRLKEMINKIKLFFTSIFTKKNI